MSAGVRKKSTRRRINKEEPPKEEPPKFPCPRSNCSSHLATKKLLQRHLKEHKKPRSQVENPARRVQCYFAESNLDGARCQQRGYYPWCHSHRFEAQALPQYGAAKNLGDQSRAKRHNKRVDDHAHTSVRAMADSLYALVKAGAPAGQGATAMLPHADSVPADAPSESGPSSPMAPSQPSAGKAVLNAGALPSLSGHEQAASQPHVSVPHTSAQSSGLPGSPAVAAAKASKATRGPRKAKQPQPAPPPPARSLRSNKAQASQPGLAPATQPPEPTGDAASPVARRTRRGKA